MGEPTSMRRPLPRETSIPGATAVLLGFDSPDPLLHSAIRDTQCCDPTVALVPRAAARRDPQT